MSGRKKWGLVLWAVLGICIISNSVMAKEKEIKIKPGCAYVIAGEKIGEGNLCRMAIGLTVSGKFIKNKGIQTPDMRSALLREIQLGYMGNEYIETDDSKFAYQIWEVPGGLIKKGGRAIVFIQSLSDEKSHFVQRDKDFFAPSIFVPIEYNSQEEFFGNAFVMESDGIYYLGDIEISGELDVQNEDGKSVRTVAGLKIASKNNEDKAKKYLKSKEIDMNELVNVSGFWQRLPIANVAEYKKGSDKVSYK